MSSSSEDRSLRTLFLEVLEGNGIGLSSLVLDAALEDEAVKQVLEDTGPLADEDEGMDSCGRLGNNG